MIKEIVKDIVFLEQKSELATKDDIEVEYFDINFKKHKQVFIGFTAQIIQHEVDHFEGIII